MTGLNPNALFAEQVNLVAGFGPIAMDAGANTGDRVNLALYEKCTVIFFKGAGTAGDDPTLTLLQADAATGGNTKALDFTKVHTKQGTLSSVGVYTEVVQTAGNTYTDAASAEVAAIWIVEIRADMLDGANGYTFVQASVADVGTNAQLGCLIYALHGAKYGGIRQPSALA